jgi:hypothetical protein
VSSLTGRRGCLSRKLVSASAALSVETLCVEKQQVNPAQIAQEIGRLAGRDAYDGDIGGVQLAEQRLEGACRPEQEHTLRPSESTHDSATGIDIATVEAIELIPD